MATTYEFDPGDNPNEAWWDSRAGAHERANSYRVEQLATDPDALSGVVDFDRQFVGDVTGKSLLHLQCHIGTDTVSWAKLGATPVVGYDLSGASLDAARRLAERAGVDATFVKGDVYEAPTVLDGRRFDVVYTGVGALNWLPSVARWAEVVGACLVPGGTFYIREGHPVLWTLDYQSTDPLKIRYPYFEQEQATDFSDEDDGDYTDTEEELPTLPTAEWNHGLAEIIQALLDVGLVLEQVREHDVCDWQAFDDFVEVDERYGHWALPDERRHMVPTMYHLRMRAPAT